MTETTIRVGQIYRHCAHGGPHIRITSYTPGQARAQVVDAVTGRNARSLLVRQLHEGPITATGRLRRAGYVLERRRDVLERLS
ncbi:hypothetical protein, partial [Streptomyces triculaminicus]|uniref:hypothetical protein n=1 Tax=Streptomyces triculaminicus TaxID=2816232 RepID=UPI00379D8533